MAGRRQPAPGLETEIRPLEASDLPALHRSGGNTRPEVHVSELDQWRDPARSLAIAYFAVPLDGEKDVTIALTKPAPLEVTVSDPRRAGRRPPRAGDHTPRYFFFDGFDPEKWMRCSCRGPGTSGTSTTPPR